MPGRVVDKTNSISFSSSALPDRRSVSDLFEAWPQMLKEACDLGIISNDDKDWQVAPDEISSFEAVRKFFSLAKLVEASSAFRVWGAVGDVPTVVVDWIITDKEKSELPQRKETTDYLISLFRGGVLSQEHFYLLICLEDVSVQNEFVLKCKSLVEAMTSGMIKERISKAVEFSKAMEDIHPAEISAVYFKHLIGR